MTNTSEKYERTQQGNLLLTFGPWSDENGEKVILVAEKDGW